MTKKDCPYWLQKPRGMHLKIWHGYLESCGIDCRGDIYGTIEANAKELKMKDFKKKYRRLLSQNSSLKREKYYDTEDPEKTDNKYELKIRLLKDSMPHNFLARTFFYLYGPKGHPILRDFYHQAKSAHLSTGWQPSVMISFFKAMYCESKQASRMDWDFFSKALYVFAKESHLLVSTYQNKKARKSLRVGLRSIRTDRKKKKMDDFVLDEKSILKDFGDLIYLTANERIEKQGESVRLLGNRLGEKKKKSIKLLSSRHSIFAKRIAEKGYKVLVPFCIRAESESFVLVNKNAETSPGLSQNFQQDRSTFFLKNVRSVEIK